MPRGLTLRFHSRGRMHRHGDDNIVPKFASLGKYCLAAQLQVVKGYLGRAVLLVYP